jgi:hypothetical protein
MAVVINEFEVVPGEPPPPPQKASGVEAGGDQSPPPSEHEMARLVQHQKCRDERVWAH